MRTITFFAALLFLAAQGVAQVKTLSKDKSKISVSGTSSLHDWTMTMNNMQGKAAFTLEGNKITLVENVQVTLKVTDLKSGKSGMDKNAYKAMDTDKNANMTFKSTSATVNGQSIKAVGNLTLAGKSKSVTLNMTCSVASGTVNCKGSLPIKMTDFGIKPPTAMMGTIKTGDALTIDLDVAFQ